MKNWSKTLALLLGLSLGVNATDSTYKVNIEANFSKDHIIQEEKGISTVSNRYITLDDAFISEHKNQVFEAYIDKNKSSMMLPLDDKVLVQTIGTGYVDSTADTLVSFEKTFIVDPIDGSTDDTLFRPDYFSQWDKYHFFGSVDSIVLEIISSNPSSINSYEEGIAFVNAFFRNDNNVTPEYLNEGFQALSKLPEIDKIMIASNFSGHLKSLYDSSSANLSSKNKIYELSHLINVSNNEVERKKWEFYHESTKKIKSWYEDSLSIAISENDSFKKGHYENKLLELDKSLDSLEAVEPEKYKTGKICGGNSNAVSEFTKGMGLKSYCISSNSGEFHISTVVKGESDYLYLLDGYSLMTNTGSIEDLVIDKERFSHISMPTRIFGDRGEEISYFQTPLVKNKFFNFTGGFERINGEFDDLFKPKENEINIKIGNVDQSVNLRKESWLFYVNNKRPNTEDYVFDNIMSSGVIKDFSPKDNIKLRTSIFTQWDYLSSESKNRDLAKLGVFNDAELPQKINLDDENIFNFGIHTMFGVNFPEINIKDNQKLVFGYANSLYGEAYVKDNIGISGADVRSIAEVKYNCDGKLNLNLRTGLENTLSVNCITWDPGIRINNVYANIGFNNKESLSDKKYLEMKSNNYFHKGFIETDNSISMNIDELKVSLNQNSSLNTWDIPIVKEENFVGGMLEYNFNSKKGDKVDLNFKYDYDLKNSGNEFSTSINLGM